MTLSPSHTPTKTDDKTARSYKSSSSKNRTGMTGTFSSSSASKTMIFHTETISSDTQSFMGFSL